MKSFESIAAGTRFASISAVIDGLLFKQVLHVEMLCSLSSSLFSSKNHT